MNTRNFILILSAISALGIAYFGVDLLLGLGDLKWVLQTAPKVLIVALLVTLVPIAAAWGGLWWLTQTQSTKALIIKFLGVTAFSWAWLFCGSIFLALLRFQ